MLHSVSIRYIIEHEDYFSFSQKKKKSAFQIIAELSAEDKKQTADNSICLNDSGDLFESESFKQSNETRNSDYANSEHMEQSTVVKNEIKEMPNKILHMKWEAETVVEDQKPEEKQHIEVIGKSRSAACAVSEIKKITRKRLGKVCLY